MQSQLFVEFHCLLNVVEHGNCASNKTPNNKMRSKMPQRNNKVQFYLYDKSKLGRINLKWVGYFYYSGIPKFLQFEDRNLCNNKLNSLSSIRDWEIS